MKSVEQNALDVDNRWADDEMLRLLEKSKVVDAFTVTAI